jgi:hypothetical protein
MRDDFPENVKRQLAMRVGHRCSNPGCRATTAGPQLNQSSSVNIGVAAHIAAASPGGPRYNEHLTPEQRRDIRNGIWLCNNCASAIDRDLTAYTEELLLAWKTIAEYSARTSMGMTAGRSEQELRPELKLYLDNQGISAGYYGDPVRRLVVGLENIGDASAKFPGIHFHRVPGLGVDPHGIDGNGRFGLPEAPSECAHIAFRGGVDNIIHPTDILKIGSLLQSGENEGIVGLRIAPRPGVFGPNGLLIDHWSFREMEIAYEIRVEGAPAVIDSIKIPMDETEWRKKS